MGPDAEFAAFLAERRFMIQRSVSTGRHVFFPRVAVPRSGESDLEWVEASGNGVVYSATVVRNKPPAQDYSIALVDLQEGPRMMTRVVDIPPQDVRIGMPVQARVDLIDNVPAVVFAPIAGDAT